MENDQTGSAEPSFVERKAEKLRVERGEREKNIKVRPDADPDTGTPGTELESAEYDLDESVLPDERDGEEFEDEIDPEDGTLDDQSEELEPEQSEVNWEKRFKDTQRELTKFQQSRDVMEKEHTDMLSETLGLKYKLEDTVSDIEQHAGFYRDRLVNEIRQLENAFNTGQVPPDKLPEARQRQQQLYMEAQQVNQQVEGIKKQAEESQRIETERKTEISKRILGRTIPDWGREKYGEIVGHGKELGFTPDELQNTDHRFIQLLHDSMQLKSAQGTRKGVKRKLKAKAPRQRNAQQPARSPDGRYRQAREEFKRNPNQKGGFAKMKLAQMQKERRGR